MKKSITGDGVQRMIINYLESAKETMLRLSKEDPAYEEGAYYIELLAESICQKIRSGKPLDFKPKDLGL